jgi:peptidoglycan hydrolase CwlO-like protein
MKKNYIYAKFEKDLGDIKKKITNTDAKVDQLDRRFQVLESKVDDIEALTGSMSRTIEELDHRMIELHQSGNGKHLTKAFAALAVVAFIRLVFF